MATIAVFILNIKAQPSGMGIEGYHHLEQSKHLESSHSFPSISLISEMGELTSEVPAVFV